jgi:hypothetical protein
MLSRVTHIALAVALTASLAGAPSAGADDAAAVAAYKTARAELLPKLRALAQWSESGQFFLERNRACEAIVVFEPDDEDARRTLHYARGKDGSWQRGIVPKSSPPDPEHAAEVAARHEETFAAFRAAVLGLVAAKDADVATRERALDELVGAEPDCAQARAANREILVGDKWVLQETAASKPRRKAVQAAIDAARKSCPAPEKGTPSAQESALATWSDVRDVGMVRVLGAPQTAEADQIARNASVLFSTCALVTGVPTPPKTHVKLLVFPSKTEGLAVVANDKRLDAEDRAFAKTLGGSFSVPKSDDVYVWNPKATARVESSMRNVVVEMLWRAFAVKGKPIWAREGVCHWYSEILLGTHECFFVRRTEYADPAKKPDDLHKRLFDDAVDWMVEARALDKAGKWPDLRISLACDANTATAEDALAAYCVARYLIEGRPDAFGDAMRAVGAAKTSPDVVAASLGSTVEGLDRRLRRWLRETK